MSALRLISHYQLAALTTSRFPWSFRGVATPPLTADGETGVAISVTQEPPNIESLLHNVQACDCPPVKLDTQPQLGRSTPMTSLALRPAQNSSKLGGSLEAVMLSIRLSVKSQPRFVSLFRFSFPERDHPECTSPVMRRCLSTHSLASCNNSFARC